MPITRRQAQDMSDAHAEGLHDDLAREGCPDCEGRDLSSYPVTYRQADPWKKIAHRLDAAHERLVEALKLIEEQPDTGHISGNLEPIVESVKRFRNLAVDKVTPNKED